MLEDEFGDILRKASSAARASTTRPSPRGPDFRRRDHRLAPKGKGAPDRRRGPRARARPRLDPGKLADAAAARWEPHVALPADVRHHPHDPHPSNGYLFFLEDGKTAALIDPAGYPRRSSRDRRGAVRAALHPHHAQTRRPLRRDRRRRARVSRRADRDAQVRRRRDRRSRQTRAAGRRRRRVAVRRAAAIRMLHTPGHTDGSSCFLFRSTLFTGDTLFAGSVGGAFGDASGYRDILDSVRTSSSRSTTPRS
jgi:hypothetical protein